MFATTARPPSPAARPARTKGLDPSSLASPISYRLSRQVFLRGLAVVYLAAFVSFGTQAAGLVGEGGILPFGGLLDGAAARAGRPDVAGLPTLLWLSPTDATLTAVWLAGAACAAGVAIGFAQLPMLVGCWAAYLSLAVVGQVFTRQSADALLLEVGALAVLVAPWQWARHPSRHAEPPPVVRWLLWWLLFRTAFAAGVLKLPAAAAWLDGSAPAAALASQPLPTALTPALAALPRAAFVAIGWVALLAGLVAPFGLLLGTRGRRLAVVPLALLPVGSAVAGNHGFGDLLGLVLCLSLLDDAAWCRLARGAAAPIRWAAQSPVPTTPGKPRLVHPREVAAAAASARQPRLRLPAWLAWPAAAAIVPLSLVATVRDLGQPMSLPDPLVSAESAVAPFRVVNRYFPAGAVAPASRRTEVVIEGSLDGTTWRPYPFRYKPGALDTLAVPCGPHLPRLDWQLANLAGAGPAEQAWFDALLRRLGEGRPAVAGLFAADPFPDAPPRFVRARAFDYRFATPAERAEGLCWRREYLLDVRRPGEAAPVTTDEAATASATIPRARDPRPDARATR